MVFALTCYLFCYILFLQTDLHQSKLQQRKLSLQTERRVSMNLLRLLVMWTLLLNVCCLYSYVWKLTPLFVTFPRWSLTRAPLSSISLRACSFWGVSRASGGAARGLGRGRKSSRPLPSPRSSRSRLRRSLSRHDTLQRWAARRFEFSRLYKNAVNFNLLVMLLRQIMKDDKD